MGLMTITELFEFFGSENRKTYTPEKCAVMTKCLCEVNEIFS